MVVTGFGQTPRGQKYIKAIEGLASKDPKDPFFKDELATAVEKLLA